MNQIKLDRLHEDKLAELRKLESRKNYVECSLYNTQNFGDKCKDLIARKKRHLDIITEDIKRFHENYAIELTVTKERVLFGMYEVECKYRTLSFKTLISKHENWCSNMTDITPTKTLKAMVESCKEHAQYVWNVNNNREDSKF